MNTDTGHLRRRCRRLNAAPYRRHGSDYVLCWLQQTLRGRANPVLDAAIAFGERFALPVVVYHGLGRGYPHASHRLHRFVLEASRSLERDVAARGIRFLRHVEREGKIEKGLVYRLAARAAVLVLDEQAAFVGRWQAETVARRLDDIAVVAVEGARLVPELALGDVCRSTSAFRTRFNALREDWLDEPLDLEPTRARFDGELPTSHDALGASAAASRPAGGDAGGGAGASGAAASARRRDRIDAMIADTGVDMTLPPPAWANGDRRAAEAHLAWAAAEALPVYAARRNDPSVAGTTRLSPWLHFGVLGPRDVVAAVETSDADARDRRKFLDEMLVWREYFHHAARHQERPNAYANLPAAARATLAAHADDPRERLYPLDALVRGETDDETWNAAQRAFLVDGWMHNNLRMYWGAQILRWTESPESAWRTACYLNDRLSLDGRDPSTYGNLRWCFGASRPARETPVYGSVARRSDGAIRRRAGAAWIREMASRLLPDVAVPETATLEPRPQASGRGAAGAAQPGTSAM